MVTIEFIKCCGTATTFVSLYGSREGHFFWTSSACVHSDSRRSSSTVADRRRLSPKVADSRRLSPIRDRKIRAVKKKFANALWPTCAKCACEKLTFGLSLDNDIKQLQDGPLWPTCAKYACEKLTFELSLDNDIKQPQDGPFGW